MPIRFDDSPTAMAEPARAPGLFGRGRGVLSAAVALAFAAAGGTVACGAEPGSPATVALEGEVEPRDVCARTAPEMTSRVPRDPPGGRGRPAPARPEAYAFVVAGTVLQADGEYEDVVHATPTPRRSTGTLFVEIGPDGERVVEGLAEVDFVEPLAALFAPADGGAVAVRSNRVHLEQAREGRVARAVGLLAPGDRTYREIFLMLEIDESTSQTRTGGGPPTEWIRKRRKSLTACLIHDPVLTDERRAHFERLRQAERAGHADFLEFDTLERARADIADIVEHVRAGRDGSHPYARFHARANPELLFEAALTMPPGRGRRFLLVHALGGGAGRDALVARAISLLDSDGDVRWAVAGIAHASYQPQLEAWARGSDPELRDRAAQTLLRLAQPGPDQHPFGPVLVRAAHHDSGVRYGAYGDLERMPPADEGRAVLLRGLAEPRSALRAGAARALAAWGDAVAAGALVQLLQSRAEHTRAFALDSLAYLHSRTLGFDPQGSAIDRARAVGRWKRWLELRSRARVER